ncbi:MAG: ferrous iron transport protein A [Chloroflexi bacterium]|nr:ferrous iron transport protein A [Chloroflexota bacterium]
MTEHCPQPLSTIKEGQAVRLVKVHAGKRLNYRLAELGLTPGVEITVLRDTGGPMLLCFRDCRLAIGKGIANKMQVLPCDTCVWNSEAEEETI